MSIGSTTNRNDYIGNDSLDTYAFNFRVLREEDLRLTIRDADDAELLLVLGDDYTVTGVGEDSGSITLTAGNLATGESLSIRRVIEITQETDIRNQYESYPEVLEDALDRSIMIDQ